jgi:hypothetical protein
VDIERKGCEGRARYPVHVPNGEFGRLATRQADPPAASLILQVAELTSLTALQLARSW